MATPSDVLLSNGVGPHGFDPIRWWDRLTRNGRCRGCYFPRHGHPIRNFWAVARPMFDKRRFTWEEAVLLQMRSDSPRAAMDEEDGDG